MTANKQQKIRAALCWTNCGIIIKKLTFTESPATIAFYMFLLTSILSAPLAVMEWQMPTTHQFLWLLVLGFSFYLMQFAVAKSFSMAKITIIIPFQFMTLIFTALIAYLAFGELVDTYTVIGAVIILASAVYILSLGIVHEEE